MRYLAGYFLIVASLLAGTVNAQVPANPYSYSRASAFEYDLATGLLTSETVEPNNPNLCVKTSYSYDGYGNKQSATTANCSGASGNALFQSRANTSNYGGQSVSVAGVGITTPSGTFPTRMSNALTQSESKTFDPRFGVPLTLVGPNSLPTSWQIDDFGRQVKEIRADGTSTINAYCFLSGTGVDTSSNSPNCPSPQGGEVPIDAISFVHSEPHNTSDQKNGPFVRVYVDRAGRKLRTVTEAFDGSTQPGGTNRLIAQDTDYNNQGVAVVATQPYFLDSNSSTSSGGGSIGLSKTVYDILGRTIQSYTADLQGSQSGIVFGSRGVKNASVTTITYGGLTTKTKNDLGQERTEEKNVNGEVVRVTDALGAQLAHQYDAFGNLVQTKDPLTNTITISYDLRGRKVAMNDPDTGIWQYDYDALGQLKWQQNANQRARGQATTMSYDVLGRMTQRLDPEYTSNWVFDNCTKGVGKLCSSNTSNGISRSFVYDGLGRPVNSLTTVSNGPSFATAIGYDSANGRPISQTYPTGLTVNYNYTGKGFLSTLSLATPATVTPLPATVGGSAGASVSLPGGSTLWQAQAYNAWGKIEQQRFGNGVTGKASFDALTGRVATTSAGVTSNEVMDYNYAFDSINRLTARLDKNGDGVSGAVSDTFIYDNIGRLQSYSVNSPTIPGLQRLVNIQYNALGSILAKSDVGAYSYPAPGAPRPHALQSVSGAFSSTYSYDAAGNLQSASNGNYRNITYNSFNLPDSQTGLQGPAGSPQYTWQYDENHQRIKETRVNGSGTRVTWMLHPDNAGGLSFESEQSGGVISNRHYLSAGGMSIGVLVSNGNLPTLGSGQTTPPAIGSITLVKVEAWHKDHLGSLVATTDHTGAVTARYSYDPFGKRRTASGNYDANGNLVIDWNNTSSGTDRGYTGHEHLDDVGVIHMNGRIFDPRLGMFMQGDPFVQQPLNLQNFNRYGYCFNNPMTCTDATGQFFGLGNLIIAVAIIWSAEKVGIIDNKTARAFTSIAVSVYLGPPASFGDAAVSGFVSGAISSGNIQGGIQGAFSASSFYGAGNVIGGGNFFTGGTGTRWGTEAGIALHGVVGCVTSVAAGGACGPGALSAAFTKGFAPVTAQLTNGDPLKGTIVSAVVGGTASVLGGGKFNNGAITGAFSYLFNDCTHGVCSTKIEQKLYDWWPGYKFGTGLYNSITNGQNDFTGWEIFDGVASAAGPAMKGISYGIAAIRNAPTLIQELSGAIEIGSALKVDAVHYAAIFARTEALETGSYFTLLGKDNISRILVQMPAIEGRFEYIYQQTKWGWELTHQMFVNGGRINGIPIKP